jgi:hypothetical protein
VNLRRRPPFIPQEDFWYSFFLEVESNPVLSVAGRIRSIEKSSELIGNRTRDIPPQATTLPRVPMEPTAARVYYDNYTNITRILMLQEKKIQLHILAIL